jgi:hypothetical protein
MDGAAAVAADAAVDDDDDGDDDDDDHDHDDDKLCAVFFILFKCTLFYFTFLTSEVPSLFTSGCVLLQMTSQMTSQHRHKGTLEHTLVHVAGPLTFRRLASVGLERPS